VKLASILALLAALGLASCASAPVAPRKAPDLATEQQQLREAMVSKNTEPATRLAEVQAVIASPTFASLAVEDQFQALSFAAGALGPSEITRQHGYLDRAIALPGIEFEDQLTALTLAVNSQYAAGADKSLTLLARQWPDRLVEVDSRLILRALTVADHVARGDMFLALQALFAAHWKLEWDIEPSAYWRNLAVLWLEQGALPQAIEVSMHITEPYVLIAMRADRRFDALVAARPDQFDVTAASARQLKHLQSLSDAHPKSLELKNRVMDVLRSQQHYEAMLAVSDSTMEDIKSTNFPERLYDDYVAKHDAFFRLRSIALQRVGQWDEAVTQLVDSARDGGVEQAIVLANLYCSLNRPQDAQGVINGVGPTRTSPYGAMQVEAVKLQAAVELQDHDEISKSLKYLGEHRTDSPDAYLFALVVAKETKQAADYLMSQLENKDSRESVLLQAQVYKPDPGSAVEMAIEAQWRALLARKEVQAAIDQVGRIQSYSLESP
jgi:hypothetical protein